MQAHNLNLEICDLIQIYLRFTLKRCKKKDFNKNLDFYQKDLFSKPILKTRVNSTKVKDVKASHFKKNHANLVKYAAQFTRQRASTLTTDDVGLKLD